MARAEERGKLSQQEVDDAIGKLTSHMKSTKPEGWDSPLRWENEFVQIAGQADMVSDEVLFALSDAFYGPKPVIHQVSRLREGDGRLEIAVKYGSAWTNHSGVGVELLWQVTRVLLDGQPLEVQQEHKHGENWSGSHQGSWQTGDHEVSVEVVCAYVDRDKLIGLYPADLPMKRWPKPMKQWTQTVSVPFKVYTKDEPIVALNTDPADDPGRLGAVRVERLVVQSNRDDTKRIILRIDYADGADLSLCADVAVAFPGQSVDLGWLWVAQKQGSRSTSGSGLEKDIPVLDPAIRSADIILTPNPRHIEDRSDVEEIWGKKIILRSVPLERLDLETGQEEG